METVHAPREYCMSILLHTGITGNTSKCVLRGGESVRRGPDALGPHALVPPLPRNVYTHVSPGRASTGLSCS